MSASKASKELSQLLQRFEGLQALRETLDRVGSLENYESELKSKIAGANRVPRTTASTRNPTANKKILPTERMPSAAPPTMPDTTARITIPRTSSITAAPMMMRASGVCIRFRSESTRAVMPTEVAVRVAPTKIATTAKVTPSGWTPIDGLAKYQ